MKVATPILAILCFFLNLAQSHSSEDASKCQELLGFTPKIVFIESGAAWARRTYPDKYIDEINRITAKNGLQKFEELKGLYVIPKYESLLKELLDVQDDGYDYFESIDAVAQFHFSAASEKELKELETFIYMTGVIYQREGAQFYLYKKPYAKMNQLNKQKRGMIHLAKQKDLSFATVYKKVQRLVKKTEDLSFYDWTEDGRFSGTVDGLIKEMAYIGNPITNNPNWEQVAGIDGRTSRSDFKGMFPAGSLEIQLHWPTQINGSVTEGGSIQIDEESVRINENFVNGDRKFLEVFAFDKIEKRWIAALYNWKKGKWVQVHETEDGKSVPQKCMACHGYGLDFGPTPKIANYYPAKGFFKFKLPEGGYYSPRGVDGGDLKEKIKDYLLTDPR